ncbi:MAG: EAL domain protein [Idiomarinaceae bacterium HL-53]|nr:MAG: EAL domain protein [Idiomarinaceae bacterium HL-53]CUS47697.1 EAL domain, c-di-GMP-specific phosphodiesterase class I (or its enzymatically inactive variant) [Idiomarinaceae bacterium HL-53]
MQLHTSPYKSQPSLARNQLAKYVVLGVLLIVLAQASRWFTINGNELSAIWPPAGIFLGAVLALGYRALWVLVPSMLVWSLWAQDLPWFMSVTGTLGLALGSSLASFLIQRTKKTTDPLQRLNYLPNLYLKGAVIGAGVSSFIGAIGYGISMPDSAAFRVQDIWLVYWLFEALGVILFAPIYSMLFREPRWYVSEFFADLKSKPVAIWLVLTASAIYASIHFGSIGDARYAPVFAFALFPLICWYAVEGRASNLHFWIPLFAAIFVYFSIYNIGGLPPVNDFTDLLRVLLQVGILSVMAQLVGSINRQRNKLLQRFQDQAQQDFLTGLANDRGLHHGLTSVLQKPPSAATPWLMFIQVPDIQVIKELLGLDGASRVELTLSAQLQNACPHAIVARINEGKYAVLHLADAPESIEMLAADIYERLTDPTDKIDLSDRLRVAMGVVPIDGKLSTAEQYLSAAIQAATTAQRKAYSLHWLADPSDVATTQRKLAQRFEGLKGAIERDELVLFAQEIRALKPTDGGQSFEILVRMRDNDGSVLSPAEFLPAAEAFGLMPVLDRWVILNTMKYLATHTKCIHEVSKCAINLSGASLSDPELADFIEDGLEEYGLPASIFTFEITETEAIRSPTEALQFIHAVHRLGCRVALDDFGTGLASFDYLRQYPFDELKIDGVFIREITKNKVDESIVSAICQVAATMQLQTVAEFVEDEIYSSTLAGLGVDFAQGYGIGKPQPLEQLIHEYQQRQTPISDTGDRPGHNFEQSTPV